MLAEDLLILGLLTILKIISILFGKLAKSQAQAAATLDVFMYLFIY